LGLSITPRPISRQNRTDRQAATGAAISWVIRCEKASGAGSRLASIKACISLADSCFFRQPDCLLDWFCWYRHFPAPQSRQHLTADLPLSAAITLLFGRIHYCIRLGICPNLPAYRSDVRNHNHPD
jgi:hypothetical protein